MLEQYQTLNKPKNSQRSSFCYVFVLLSVCHLQESLLLVSCFYAMFVIGTFQSVTKAALWIECLKSEL